MTAYRLSKCLECGITYRPRRWDQSYCKKPCNLKAHNRDAVRGALIFALAYRWRADRKGAKGYLRALCGLLAKFRQEDAALGRPMPKLTKEQQGLMA